MSTCCQQETGRQAGICLGGSTSPDIIAVVKELTEQIYRPDAELAVIFASPSYDLKQLGPLLQQNFKSCPVIGCSTAGEITPNGYSENAISGFSLSSRHTTAKSFILNSIRNLNPSKMQACAKEIHENVTSLHTKNPHSQSFALFLIDGMSIMEEQVVALIHQALGGIPLIGGSAGDDLDFKETWVLHAGEFQSDAALVTIIDTTLPFETFKTQHFLPTETKLVITNADPVTRTVFEINGLPAAEEYARLIGVEKDALVPEVFSRYPVMLKLGDEYYVRSLQRKNNDGSLTFYCAIDNGLVLTLGKGIDIVDNTRRTLDEISHRVNDSQLLITCECVLRRLEVLQHNQTTDMNAVLAKHHAIGFHSYGEQFNAVHVNQTFTGVMIGSAG